jgi:predicted MFS family arabinose efflux permease
MSNSTCLCAEEQAAREPGRGTVALMAGAAGLSVASIYYNQPMLAILARQFHAGPDAVSWIAVLTQAGYALGLVFLSPLGDRFERRGLIVATFLALALSLGLAAAAPGMGAILAASLGLGLFATVAQQVVPMAAHLAGESRRGSVVGTVMAGLLTGILLSRTVSGIVSEYGNWRAMFAGAGLACLALGAVLALRLPRVAPVTTMSYPRMLASLVRLLAEHRTLRRAGLVQGLLFGGFVAFWANLALFLEQPPFHQGSSVAGLLGLVGAAGVAAAPLAGRLADRAERDGRGGRGRLVACGALAVALAFVLLGLFRESWTVLIAAILLMDVGLQSAMVANQSRIYGLDASARSRINTVYMTVMFVGGALGTALGAQVFARFGWLGVCVMGAACGLAALVLELAGSRQAA